MLPAGGVPLSARGGTLGGMPTTKHRWQITETPELSAALSIARHRWPHLSTSAQITKLAEVGADALTSNTPTQDPVSRWNTFATLDLTEAGREQLWQR
jgi:hypothetical protein